MKKIYLVTGCSKGLGKSITKLLLNKKYTVIGVSRTKVNFNGDFIHIPLDLSSGEDHIKNFLLENKISLDGFVNNAAYAYDDIISNLNRESLSKMFNVNVFTPMMLTKVVLRNFLLYKKKGSILHISSISAHTGYKGLSMYAATKGALESFSKATAREWGRLGIKSNCVVPGFMETEMSSTLTDDQRNRIAKRTSLGNLTDIKSVASTVVFLLSESAHSLTGQNIFVDSGTI
ncbi:MAG: SDR family oxidoreductase [Rickettsiales bacterium TMED289]|nr:MAG: SDR family oxidoreductase [Rickettsiales bacterium TMED289]|tara:strand:- start:905 stop:1600 length:696 start_codon:yes stop_codon:yes gene_type:complete